MQTSELGSWRPGCLLARQHMYLERTRLRRILVVWLGLLFTDYGGMFLACSNLDSGFMAARTPSCWPTPSIGLRCSGWWTTEARKELSRTGQLWMVSGRLVFIIYLFIYLFVFPFAREEALSGHLPCAQANPPVRLLILISSLVLQLYVTLLLYAAVGFPTY